MPRDERRVPLRIINYERTEGKKTSNSYFGLSKCESPIQLQQYNTGRENDFN